LTLRAEEYGIEEITRDDIRMKLSRVLGSGFIEEKYQ